MVTLKCCMCGSEDLSQQGITVGTPVENGKKVSILNYDNEGIIYTTCNKNSTCIQLEENCLKVIAIHLYCKNCKNKSYIEFREIDSKIISNFLTEEEEYLRGKNNRNRG